MRLAGNLHAEMLLGLTLRGAGALSSFVLLWMIARLFGADAVGLYQLALTTTTLSAMFVGLGLPVLLVRTLANLIQQDRLGDARATFMACCRAILWRGLPVIALIAVLAEPFARHLLGEARVAPFLAVFAPAALLLALLLLSNSLLRTAGRVVVSQSLEGAFYTTLAALVLAVAWTNDWDASALLPALAYVVSLAFALAISLYLSLRLIVDWPAGSSALRPTQGVSVAAAPITMAGGEWLILLMITFHLGIAAGGVYRTAFQFCMLFQLVNSSFAMMVGPHLARAAGAQEPARIRVIVRSAGLIGLAICLPLALAGLFVPGWILGLFGPEFQQGALALQILVVSQAINVGFGPVGAALVMLHRERYVLALEIVATAAGLAVAYVTIGPLGIAGAALGVLFASTTRNVANFLKMRSVLSSGRLDALEGPTASTP
jgi:O-antigen/teichoic acid export membrane protein